MLVIQEMGSEGNIVMRVLRNLHIILMASAIAFALSFKESEAGGLGCAWPCYEEVSVPPIHRTLTRRVEIEPGVYEIAREPALYGWVTKKVLVSPTESWKDGSEPVYRYVKKRILLRQYKNIAVYHRARHRYVRERVIIQPESTAWEATSGYSGKDW